MAKDPICGMMVDEKTAKFKATTKAKPTTSALQPAKIRSIKIQQNMESTKPDQDSLQMRRKLNNKRINLVLLCFL